MNTNRLLLTLAMALCLAFSNMMPLQAGKGTDLKVNYVLQNIGVKRDVQAKLKPLLISYLAEKKEANKAYDDLKAKLKTSINNGTLTEKQAQALLNAKWNAAEKELAVKRKYEIKFNTVLSIKKTYFCFSLLNDKKSKMQGKDDDYDD